MEKPVKKVRWGRALLLSIFLGQLGVDRFYLGQPILGMLKFLTLGGFGFWWAYDIYLIATQKVKGVKFEEPKEVDTYVPRNAKSAKRLREAKKLRKEMGLSEGFSDIINMHDERADMLEEAIKRKDRAVAMKLLGWYIQVQDHLGPRLRARFERAGRKMDKIWKK